jgi:uncharacterized protein (TIGR00369 family)
MPSSKQRLQIDDPSLVAVLRDIFEERVVFNKTLGMKVISLDPKGPKVRFDMRPDLVGNYMRSMLHGGVISSVLDVSCGVGAMLSLIEKHIAKGEPLEAQVARFSRLSTIDLRVDFLRPGVGQWFVATAEVMRSGNRVAVVRSELRNDSEELIAAAVATYTVS